MNDKDKAAMKLLRDFLAHHDTETNVHTKIAVSGERRMRVRIERNLPNWLELLQNIWENRRGN